MKKAYIIKRIFIVLLAILFITPLVSCAKAGSFFDFNNYFVKKSDYDAIRNDNEEKADKLKNLDILIQSLTEENTSLVKKLSHLEEELSAAGSEILELKEEIESLLEYHSTETAIENDDPARIRKLLYNLNNLLKNVYIGSSEMDNYGYTFTAFSINYKGRYFIITAGHCVADNYGSEGNFKFKSNFSDNWISPSLLGYKADFWALDDYAVFYSPEIKEGLNIGEFKTPGNYVLGSVDKRLSICRDLGGSSRRGESGSPVINENMEVIGIYVVYGYVFTPISLALQLIDDSF